jgi:hypothetical protein
LIDWLLLPVLEAVHEALSLHFPFQFAQTHERLGQVGSLFGALRDERREQLDRLLAQRLDLIEIRIDARVELRLQLDAQVLRQSGTTRGASRRARRVRRGALL